ncbi:RES family NAD+ phosphorylase [Limimaricola litoreus]|uniref:RES family NAD+ phosphorylase n=1 Tax=Limimaricola litoreus TaxID=2955316 RepID=A0A9X2FYJ9_9RHOB|nr:RES family NAD+ phosphorylase [Limimaricola litoreus]MCP1169853.1 RES family NAD+ phosphorylase [Limimaricola litoreus]
MPKFPEPPSVADLQSLGPECRIAPAGFTLGRIFMRGGPHPADWSGFRHWGPTQSRFDHHELSASGTPCDQTRGIQYSAGPDGAGALATCAAEVFQLTRVINRKAGAPWFCVFGTVRSLSLLDLTGRWPTRAGASAAIATGPRARARRWSVAIYDAYPTIDGLIYRSSMAGDAEVVALFERAGAAMPLRPDFHRALDDPALQRPLLDAAAAIGYDLV